MMTLDKIVVYPIKSLDGVSLETAAVLNSGALEWDRRFAIVNHRGEVLTGKTTPSIHAVRAAYDLDRRIVQLKTGSFGDDSSSNLTVGASAVFSLGTDGKKIAEWFGAVLNQPCRLIEDSSQGFPDDAEALGPTVISTATIREVASWFDGLSIDETRRRFRANLEVDAPEPFWEDRLVGATRLQPVRFRIGAVEFLGRNPCARCSVPSRSSETGEATPQFAKTFARRREDALPNFAPRERFDHFYRLAVNTSLARAEELGRLFVGDSVALSTSL